METAAGLQLSDLPTPSVLVERRRLEQNLQRMQDKAAAEGVKLRPHVKTHKSTAIVDRQSTYGARGFTVATVSEAESLWRAGQRDLRIAYTVAGRDKLKRVLALHPDGAITFCVDTRAGAEAASQVFADAGAMARVLMEVDVGHHRTGVPWDGDQAIELAQRIHHLPGIQLVGLLTHAGQAYFGPSEGEPTHEALRRHATDERDRLLHVAGRLHEQGLVMDPERFVLSVGSTPTMAAFANRQEGPFRISEIRPGNYVFYDAMQVALGSARWPDCALTVLATVVSKRRERDGSEWAFVDAGKKVLTSDTGFGTAGYGTVLYNAVTMTPLPHARLTTLSEEHGWIHVRGGSTLEVGDRIRLVPNHACVVAATQQRLFLVDGEDVVGEIPVDVR